MITSSNASANPIIPSWALMAILASLMALTSLSTDIYLPAMPEMGQQLHGNVELTVTGFLLGFAIAQLIWGPISDRIGRKKPLYLGMILFIIGSAGCALSQSIEQIVFWRVFQAIGACTAPMLARAMVRDLYDSTQAARMLSSLMVIMAIAPIIGPLVGGQIVKYSTWHSIFWLLVGIGALLWVALLFLPESHRIENRSNASLTQVFTNYQTLLKNRLFMRYTLCVTFFYVSAYTFIVGSPFVYIRYYGVSEQHYGWLFAMNIVGLMIMSTLNRHWVLHHSLQSLLCKATLFAMTSMLVLSGIFALGFGNMYWVMAMVFGFFSMNGVVAANATAGALDGVPEIAGSASALIGSLQYGSGIISSLLLAWLSNDTPTAMIGIMAVFATGSAMMGWVVKHH